MCASVSSMKSTRSLDTVSAEAVRTLLELVEMSSQVNLFRMVILGIPLVGCKRVQQQSLKEMEEEMLKWRAKLSQASEAVAEFGEKFLEKVGYKSLDTLALAAQQRRIIQNHLGSFPQSTVAPHLAGQVVAGSVELERSQSRTWYRSSCRQE